MILFDGDRIDMKGSLVLTESGQTSAKSVGTPYKKYYNTVDYIYCPIPSQCEIHIGGQMMAKILCRSYYAEVTVSYRMWTVE